MTATTETIHNMGVIRAIEKAWAAIRQANPEVPEVRLALGERRYSGRKLAHFGPATTAQQAELWVSIKAQHMPGQDLLGVLLHEAAHGLAHARGVEATTRQGRYHNNLFSGLAAELGLVPSEGRSESEGWAAMGPLATEHYRRTIALLDQALTPQRSLAAVA